MLSSVISTNPKSIKVIPSLIIFIFVTSLLCVSSIISNDNRIALACVDPHINDGFTEQYNLLLDGTALNEVDDATVHQQSELQQQTNNMFESLRGIVTESRNVMYSLDKIIHIITSEESPQLSSILSIHNSSINDPELPPIPPEIQSENSIDELNPFSNSSSGLNSNNSSLTSDEDYLIVESCG
ncbi:hypothetical protein [Candidatus Nitrosocosmicus sp. T]